MCSEAFWLVVHVLCRVLQLENLGNSGIASFLAWSAATYTLNCLLDTSVFVVLFVAALCT